MIPTAISLVGTVILLLDIFAIVSVLLGSSGVAQGDVDRGDSVAANRWHGAVLPHRPDLSGCTRLKGS